MFLVWWSKIVDRHPHAIITFVLLTSFGLVSVELFLHSLPSFNDPLLGFESRGTEISNRINAWKLLMQSTSWSGSLTMNPKNVDLTTGSQSGQTNRPYYKDKDDESDEEEKNVIDEMAVNHNRYFNVKNDKMFCGKLMQDYGQFVVEANDGSDLFTFEAIKTQCQIDHYFLRLESNPNQYKCFEQNCEQTNSKSCCPSWSLANYIAFATNKSSCFDITENDVRQMFSILKLCAPFYHNLKLNEGCHDDPLLCQDSPKICFQSANSVYNIMHYLVNYEFLHPNSSSQNLIHVNIFLPIAKSTKLLHYYNEISKYKLQQGNLRIVAMDLGLKSTLFDKFLMDDSLYLVLAILLILMALYLYSTSLLITFIAVVIIVLSITYAYIIYMNVFQMKFFPFINFLAIVIAIGIGCDNVFIFCKVWECMKLGKTCGPLNKIIKDTLTHTLISSFAASSTTSVAFFATYFSSITAIKCFSLFSGTSVIMNLIFTFLLLPPAMVICERSSFDLFMVFPFYWKIHKFMAKYLKLFFEKIIFIMVIKLRYFWILLFGSIAVASILIVTYKPKLQLPDSEEFQIFHSNHPFEKYDFEYKNKFWFSRAKSDSDISTMPIRVVFGVKPIDNGDYLNPFNRGTLQFDQDFNIAYPQAQVWLLEFCKEIRNHDYYHPTIGPLLSNCFIETFKSWMEDLRCIDVTNVSRYPCCNESKFPFMKDVFNYCLRNVITSLEKTPSYFVNLNWAGPRFDKNSSNLVAAVIEYDSNVPFTHSFNQMNMFWQTLNSWISDVMKKTPMGLDYGWVISNNLEFYSLQLSLSHGTIIAIALAVSFAFITLILTTWNIILSLIAIITITCIIFTTIAILILLEWKLNIVESITISLAIGLAIDLTLHYTIAYKLTINDDPILSIQSSFFRIGTSIAMAALTTILAGLVMLPSSVLAYVQIGIFLVLLSFVSWIYSTIFHLSLLSIIGPNKVNYCNGSLCSFPCGQNNSMVPNVRSTTTIDSISSDKPFSKKTKALHAFSSSTISTSSTTNVSGCHQQELHELEPLSF